MILRALKEQDRKDFIEMCLDFYSGEAVLHTIPEENIIKTFEAIIQGNPYIKGHIIEGAGEIAGYGLHWLYWSNEAGGLMCFIDEIYVKAEYRGQRLGTEYLEFLKEIYKDLVVGFRLEVFAKNDRATKLYERLGFENLDYDQMIRIKGSN